MELIIGKKFKFEVWEAILKKMSLNEVAKFRVHKSVTELNLCNVFCVCACKKDDIHDGFFFLPYSLSLSLNIPSFRKLCAILINPEKKENIAVV